MAEKSDIQLRKEFDKETFKEMVKENVKTLYRRTIDEATQQQLFQAVSYAVKEAIIDDWLATQEAYKKSDAKTVYYMSMEFLMGRALGNNLINLTVYDGRPGAGCGSWKRRSRKTGGMLSGFTGNTELSGVWMRNPVSLRHVQAEDQRRLSGGNTG